MTGREHSRGAKQLVKAAVTRTAGCFVGNNRGRKVVLCYHSVHPSKQIASVSPNLFALHLDWLEEHCDVVPLRAIAGGPLPRLRVRPTVAITFDDGYADNYEFAFPQLQSRTLPATFFVTAGLLENDARVIARMQSLRGTAHDDIRPMEWAHIRSMSDAGMEIGGHTYSHPNLAMLDRATALEELWVSKDLVEQRMGKSVQSLAYPFGKPRRHFTPETISLVEQLGYEYACAVLFRDVRCSDSRFEIPRFFIRRDTVQELRAKVFGAWDAIGMWQEKSPLWLARRVSPRDFAV